MTYFQLPYYTFSKKYFEKLLTLNVTDKFGNLGTFDIKLKVVPFGNAIDNDKIKFTRKKDQISNIYFTINQNDPVTIEHIQKFAGKILGYNLGFELFKISETVHSIINSSYENNENGYFHYNQHLTTFNELIQCFDENGLMKPKIENNLLFANIDMITVRLADFIKRDFVLDKHYFVTNDSHRDKYYQIASLPTTTTYNLFHVPNICTNHGKNLAILNYSGIDFFIYLKPGNYFVKENEKLILPTTKNVKFFEKNLKKVETIFTLLNYNVKNLVFNENEIYCQDVYSFCIFGSIHSFLENYENLI